MIYLFKMFNKNFNFDPEAFQGSLKIFIYYGLGLLSYHLYLVFKNKKIDDTYSDQLRDVVKNYIMTGDIKGKEIAGLLHLCKDMGNKYGIYRQHVDRAVSDAHINQSSEIIANAFDAKDDLKDLSKEKQEEIKKLYDQIQMLKQKDSDFIDALIEEPEND